MSTSEMFAKNSQMFVDALANTSTPAYGKKATLDLMDTHVVYLEKTSSSGDSMTHRLVIAPRSRLNADGTIDWTRSKGDYNLPKGFACKAFLDHIAVRLMTGKISGNVPGFLVVHPEPEAIWYPNQAGSSYAWVSPRYRNNFEIANPNNPKSKLIVNPPTENAPVAGYKKLYLNTFAANPVYFSANDDEVGSSDPFFFALAAAEVVLRGESCVSIHVGNTLYALAHQVWAILGSDSPTELESQRKFQAREDARIRRTVVEGAKEIVNQKAVVQLPDGSPAPAPVAPKGLLVKDSKGNTIDIDSLTVKSILLVDYTDEGGTLHRNQRMEIYASRDRRQSTYNWIIEHDAVVTGIIAK